MLANFCVSAAVILLFLTRVASAWRRSEPSVAKVVFAGLAWVRHGTADGHCRRRARPEVPGRA
jgi:hypothetical protein